MPLRRHARTSKDPATGRIGSAMIASAALISRKQVASTSRIDDWQRRSWEFFDTVGELRFAARWISNAMSRCRLYVGEPDSDGAGDPIALDNPGPAQAILEELFEGQLGQSEALRRLGIHLTIPGESYMVGYDDPDTDERRWLTLANEEFSALGEKISIKMPDSDEEVEFPIDQVSIIRLWQPHPRRAWNADSPVRAALPILREVVSYGDHVRATVDSRLAGAGVFTMPESASFPTPQQSEGANPIHDDPFVSSFTEAMVTPISNPDSAAAVVPIVLRIPEGTGEDFKHHSFATPLDDNLDTLRNAALKRLATALDLPPEIILGLGETNHWSSWQIEESAVKMHVTPLMGVICDAITTQYLWPALRAAGISEVEKYVIWFDTSELVLRPNRAPEAITLHQQGLINAEAVRRENGFGEEDAPDDDELQKIIITQLALTQPQVASQMLELLGIEVPEPATGAEPGTGQPGESGSRGGLPSISRRSPSRNEIPQRQGENDEAEDADEQARQRGRRAAAVEDSWMIRALEGEVVRALEKVGGKLLTRQFKGSDAANVERWQVYRTIPREQHPVKDLDKLLDGAYTGLAQICPDAPCLHAAVDQYVRALVLSGEQHDRRYLVTALRQAGCLNPGGSRAA